MKLTAVQLAKVVGIPLDRAFNLVTTVNTVFEKWQIDSPIARAHFLANCSHETRKFTKLRESMFYTTWERIWEVFRVRMDLDKDRVPDPNEIALCKSLVKNERGLANHVYGGRFGNRPSHTDDGYNFRGGGWTHLTFYDNYDRYGSLAGYQLTKNPDLITDQMVAGHTAGAYYLHFPGLFQAIQKPDVAAVRKLVNGGTNGLEEVQSAFKLALSVLQGA